MAFACPSCATRLATRLHEIVGLPEALADAFARQTRTTTDVGVHTQGAATPLPWDERASAAARALRAALGTWTRVVCEERGTEPPADTLPAMAELLAANLEWLRHQPAAGQAVDDLCRAVDDAWHAVDRRPDRLYAGQCWRDTGSGQQCPGELYAALTAATVTCPVCGGQFDVVKRRAWLLEAARDVIANATLVSAALTRLDVPVTADRLWKWNQRGRIFNHSRPGAQPTYRVGDVIDLLDAYAVQQVEREARKAG
jgi:hypothetical protein